MDSVAYAVQQVSELLQRFSFPKEKIPAVVEAIRTRLPSGRPDTVGGVLLQDAELRIGLL